MYQALYRKWRPRTFDDVVGQDHITETLKRQVASGRLSHAYLFTGTRGTGKTTCAKILSRAVNCQNPVDGNPCNQCPACLGIENGSILDVLELDAASNNGVDQVRALRDEAVYTPAAVRKRVYIVDEVHMLSTAAFNALLKILEEPPEHLMFILATTELHKVPATIKSRCQQFSFKRISTGDIAARLAYVARQEGMELRGDAAELLARLADGGLRDALSLLDQCAGAGQRVDEQEILDTLGLAGNLETAKLMGLIAARDTAGALETLGRLYGNGKDVSSVLEELSSLARDLLLRKTAPQGGAALLTGGYDAMVNYECLVISANQELEERGEETLYAVYPYDGLSIADSPLGYVDNGNDRKEEAFLKLQEYLLSDEVQNEIQRTGRRTGYEGVSAENADVFRADWGVQPDRVLSPIRMPSTDVLMECLDLYQTQFRKPSLTVYCLDYSGSMEGIGREQMVEAMSQILIQENAEKNLLQASEHEVNILIPFEGYPRDVYTAEGNGAELEALNTTVQDLEPEGGTDMYAAAIQGLEELEKYDLSQYTPAIILLTDGQSEGSFRAFADAYQELGAQVPVFSIMFGDADESQLEDLAELTNARVFDGREDLVGAFRSVKGYN